MFIDYEHMKSTRKNADIANNNSNWRLTANDESLIELKADVIKLNQR